MLYSFCSCFKVKAMLYSFNEILYSCGNRKKTTKLNTSQVHQGEDHNNCICGKDVLDLPDTQTSMVNPISPTGVRGNWSIDLSPLLNWRAGHAAAKNNIFGYWNNIHTCNHLNYFPIWSTAWFNVRLISLRNIYPCFEVWCLQVLCYSFHIGN